MIQWVPVVRKGQRVQAIVNELKGENMDIVEWNEIQAIYISNALNPAQVLDVIFDPENSKHLQLLYLIINCH